MNKATYEAALFNQFLAFEFRKAPKDVKGSIGRALIRFSPNATPRQQDDYVQSILETITDENGSIAQDWSERIAQHH